MDYTLLNAVVGDTTSSNQAVVGGLATIIAKTTGNNKDIGLVTVFVEDVIAVTMSEPPYVKTIATGKVDIKVNAIGSVNTPITVTIHDEE